VTENETRLVNVTRFKIRLTVVRRGRAKVEMIELGPGDGFLLDRRLVRTIQIGLWDDDMSLGGKGR